MKERTLDSDHPTPTDGVDRSLARDQGGAIMVMAVFMSAFLVGALYYLIGIGDAIIYKQNMQAAADSTAYIGAVYHARGMNVIATLNIIMASVIVVLIAAKILQYIATMVAIAANVQCSMAKAAAAVSGGAVDDDGACAAVNAAKAYWDKLQLVVNAVETEGDALLKALSAGQKDVAVVSPWVAHKRSADVDSDYNGSSTAPLIEETYAVSISMQPSGTRLGLPVIEEDFKIACDRAKRLVPEVVMQNIPPYFETFIWGDLGGLIVGMVLGGSSYPDKLCSSGGPGMREHKFFDSNDLCDKHGDKYGYGKDSGKTKEDCTKDVDKEFDDNADGNNSDTKDEVNATTSTPKIDDKEKTAKSMYEPAENGNDYFQVYGIVQGTPTWLDHASQGVEIAAWQTQKVADASPNALFKMAQGEFYYDQTPAVSNLEVCLAPPGQKCGMAWDQYKHSALYNLRWRGRLRFLRPAANADVNIFGTGIGDPGDIGTGLVSESILTNFQNNLGNVNNYMSGQFSWNKWP